MCLRVTWMLGRGPTSRLLDVFSLPVVLALWARFEEHVREAVLIIAKVDDEWDGGKGIRGEDGGQEKKGGEKRGKKSNKVVFGLSLRIRAGKDWYDLDDKISQMKSAVFTNY